MMNLHNIRYKPKTSTEFRNAVRVWAHGPLNEKEKYGHISNWDTSEISDMSFAFNYMETFNEDISRWNTSKVTTMRCMFNCANAFNGNISGWDTSRVTNMQCMFTSAHKFNGDISGWDTSCVTNMEFMFTCAYNFNGNISGWDVSNVASMNYMFTRAVAFDGDISGWDTSNVKNATIPTNLIRGRFVRMFEQSGLEKKLIHYNIPTPFNISMHHQYHNFKRRRAFIQFTHTIRRLPQTLNSYTAFTLDEMVQEICQFV